MTVEQSPRLQRVRIAIVSSNPTPWGGSEELWQRAALEFARQGARVRVYKQNFPRSGRPIEQLREAGCGLVDLALPGRLHGLISLLCSPVAATLMKLRLLFGLLIFQPRFVLLSQGTNWDGVSLARVIYALRIPYAVIAQKASELYWPSDHVLDRVRALYMRAVHAVFVSEHNRELTETQLGCALQCASVARNPFLVSYDTPVDWPQGPIDLACVGRLYPLDKGQDLLLTVLARDTWRSRPVSVTFYGEGSHRRALEQMAARLNLHNVRFAGQVEDVTGLWRRHQALILPSRCEGLPLAVVEAMLAGRVVIATDAGGTSEVVENNATGFVASAATADALDEAMERAWARRDEWPAIAASATRSIRRLVPPDPGVALVETLEHYFPMSIGVRPVAAAPEPLEPALVAAEVHG